MYMYEPDILGFASALSEGGHDYGIITGTVQVPAASSEPTYRTFPDTRSTDQRSTTPPALAKGKTILDNALASLVPPAVRATHGATVGDAIKNATAAVANPGKNLMDDIAKWLKSISVPFTMGILGLVFIIGGIYLFGNTVKVNVSKGLAAT